MSKTNPSPASPAVPRGTFTIASVLAHDAFPHAHKFTEGGFNGLTVHYKDLPSTWLVDVAVHVSEPLSKLGFEPGYTVLHLIGGVPLTGDEFLRFEGATDALTATQKQEVTQILEGGIRAVVAGLVGSWNASEPIETHLLPLLEKYPSMLKALFQLAKTATLSPEK